MKRVNSIPEFSSIAGFFLLIAIFLFFSSCTEKLETIGPNHCVIHINDMLSVTNPSPDSMVQSIAKAFKIRHGAILKANVLYIKGHPLHDILSGDTIFIITREEPFPQTKYLVFNHYDDKKEWFTHTWYDFGEKNTLLYLRNGNQFPPQDDILLPVTALSQPSTEVPQLWSSEDTVSARLFVGGLYIDIRPFKKDTKSLFEYTISKLVRNKTNRSFKFQGEIALKRQHKNYEITVVPDTTRQDSWIMPHFEIAKFILDNQNSLPLEQTSSYNVLP